MTLLLSSSTFGVFANEEGILVSEEKQKTENILTEDVTEDAMEDATKETKDISEEALKIKKEVVKENRWIGRAIVQNGTIGTASWTLDDAGVLTFGGGTLPNEYMWSNFGNGLSGLTKTVNFTAPITGGDSLRDMFSNYSQLTAINGLEKLDTRNVTSMSGMFSGCSSLTSLDVSSFNTSNVTVMSWMFYGCSSLTSLDLSNFDTSKVTRMDHMFRRSSALTTVDISSFDTSRVTMMEAMFEGCNNLISLDLSNFDTSKATLMSEMFSGCSSLTSLDVSSFNTSNVVWMSDMFRGCSSLTSLDVSSFNTSNVAYMSGMFRDCSSLTSLDVTGFNTSDVRNMSTLFYNCSSLTSLDVSNFDTSKVTNMVSMFGKCSGLTSLDVSNFDTSKVTMMSSMFQDCRSLTSLDVSNFVTSNVVWMNSMFWGCSGLTSLDLSSFDTSKVVYMIDLVRQCSSLTSLDVSSFDTSNVKRMEGMFQECTSLTSLDLSSFDTSNVERMEGMFEASAIRELTLGPKFRFKYTNHKLGEPVNDVQYTGKWKFEGTEDVLTHAELLVYDGTKAGTYVWQRRAYNVTYNSNGGSVVADEMVEYNGRVTEPANPTKAGYTFDGWYKETGLTNKWNFMTDLMPTENITLYAKWKAAEYQITYNLDGGTNSINNPSTYEFAVGVNNFEDPTKEGYKFLGWFESDASNVEITNIGTSEIGDKTLYARWEKTGAPVEGGIINKRGTSTGDEANLLGLGAILLISGGYIVSKKAKRKNNG